MRFWWLYSIYRLSWEELTYYNVERLVLTLESGICIQFFFLYFFSFLNFIYLFILPECFSVLSKQNIGAGSLSLLQGIFPTQGLNAGLLLCGRILYQLSHKGSSRILEWVAYPFSCSSSQPKNRTGVSCIAGRFFTNWVIREPHVYRQPYPKVYME